MLGTAVYLALIGLLLVVPVILQVLLGAWVKTVGQYLPSNAGSSFITTLRMPDTLAPWIGLGVLILVMPADLIGAIRTVARVDAVIAPSVTRRLLGVFAHRLPEGDPAPAAADVLSSLTD